MQKGTRTRDGFWSFVLIAIHSTNIWFVLPGDSFVLSVVSISGQTFRWCKTDPVGMKVWSPSHEKNWNIHLTWQDSGGDRLTEGALHSLHTCHTPSLLHTWGYTTSSCILLVQEGDGEGFSPSDDVQCLPPLILLVVGVRKRNIKHTVQSCPLVRPAQVLCWPQGVAKMP